MRTFAKLFTLQFISYLNITIDMRAIAHQQYVVAAATNCIAPLIAFIMIKAVHDSRSAWDKLAVVLGGALSTLAGMWLTRVWS